MLNHDLDYNINKDINVDTNIINKQLPIFSNNPEDFILNIQKMPEDIIKWCIMPYISPNDLMNTCKKHYENNHKLKKIVSVQKTEIYIRMIVKKDFNYVFRILMQENYDKWLNMTHWYYNQIYYSNYIDFLQEYCVENDSLKCLEEITNMRLQHIL